MAKSLSEDLRVRVIQAVESGLLRRATAHRGRVRRYVRRSPFAGAFVSDWDSRPRGTAFPMRPNVCDLRRRGDPAEREKIYASK